MSYSPLAPGFFVVGSNGLPAIEESRQGNYVLVFLRRADAIQYSEQMSEIRHVSKKDYAIATMPIHQIQRLLSHRLVKVCVIDKWDAIVA